jgi:hypothetical protein
MYWNKQNVCGKNERSQSYVLKLSLKSWRYENNGGGGGGILLNLKGMWIEYVDCILSAE